MKCLLLVFVVIIAVFQDNCRAAADTDGPDGPGLKNSLTELQKDVNERNHIKSRGKAEKKILKKLIDDLESMNTELKMELQSITGKLDAKLDSIIDLIRVTTSTLPTTTAAPTTTSAVTTSTLPTTTAAPTTTPPAVCPEGFFKEAPNSGNRCYKLFIDSRQTWQASVTKCEDEGLVLASKPDDPVALRKLLVETYGSKEAWLYAAGTGSSVAWSSDGSTISSSNSAWYPGDPGSKTSTGWCLLLLSHSSSLGSQPTQPYYMYGCASGRYALCQLSM